MTPLITLSIACTTFVVGFALGLMGFALFSGLRREAEGDQVSKFDQASPS